MSDNRTSPPEVGSQFGCWEVIGTEFVRLHKDSKYKRAILCKCEHIEKLVLIDTLTSGKSTGCQRCSGEKKFRGTGNLAGSYINSLKIGAKKRGLTFDLSSDFLWELFQKQEGRCSLSNVEITLDKNHSVNGSHKKVSQTASLDRIDSSLGYVHNNVQWIHKHLNKIKGDLNQDLFIDLCKAVSNKNEFKSRVTVGFKFRVEGIHRWKLCPIEEVSYLRDYHRHLFHIEIESYVNHSNRDIEFIELSHKIKKYLNDRYFCKNRQCLFFDDMSCEMIADELVKRFDLCKCCVFEDGEGGATVTNF